MGRPRKVRSEYHVDLRWSAALPIQGASIVAEASIRARRGPRRCDGVRSGGDDWSVRSESEARTSVVNRPDFGGLEGAERSSYGEGHGSVFGPGADVEETSA